MFSYTSKSSLESNSLLSSCCCSFVFLSSSHSCRPNGRFTTAARLFLLHSDGPHRKSICEYNGVAGFLGLKNESSLGCLITYVVEAWDHAGEFIIEFSPSIEPSIAFECPHFTASCSCAGTFITRLTRPWRWILSECPICAITSS